MAPAHAAIIFDVDTDQNGNGPTDPKVQVTISENAGALDFMLDVFANPNNIADMRGAFINLSLSGTGISDLTTINVSGDDVTDVQVNTSNTGGGNNVNPLGPFDLGIEIGTSGIGGDDLQSTAFSVSHDTVPFDFSNIIGEDIAIRLTSVGPAGSSRDGSLKLQGTVPDEQIPLPATVGLLGMGLFGLGLALRRRERFRA